MDASFYKQENMHMIKLAKKIISKRLIKIAKKLRRKLFDGSPGVNLSKEYKALETQNALKCKIAYNEYGGYCVPLSSHHRPAARNILSNKVHEPETIKYVLDNCNDGDIVHAGTYFGDFLPAFSKGVAPNAKVWAFEPNPENYRCARITLELNGIENTVLTNAGLGDKKATLLIKTRNVKGQALGGSSRIITEKLDNEKITDPVQVVTIDDAVNSERFVSIIQLDVEGYEKEALIGASKTIQRCLPIIILEAWSKSTLQNSEWFSNNILALGYRKIDNVHGNSVFSCEGQIKGGGGNKY